VTLRDDRLALGPIGRYRFVPMGSGRHAAPRRALRGIALSTVPALLLHAVLVAALVAGTTAFVTRDRTVTLSVDGRTTQVSTLAGTVGDLLEDRDITVDLAHDMVVPLPGAKLKDGQTIVVRFGRRVVLSVDGETRTLWTTARTVSDAMRALGVRSAGAYVSASRDRRISRGGIELDVRLPRHVTFIADGALHEVTTTAPTLRSALAEAGLVLGAEDRVDADLAEPPYPEQVVGVTRVDGKNIRSEKAIPFDTVKRKTKDLYEGETEVVRQGKVGIIVRRYTATYVDGELESRELISEKVVAQPVTEIVRVGTRERPQNTPTADGLNWAALAQCESSGNPSAVNPAGPYYGLYQFLASTWQSVGGTGVPTDHSAAEQTYRAQLLYQRSGAGQWPVCGRLLFQ
jgi:resuscitation-promoting factor RpfB